jgi:SAM-dependent methyltransferase
VTTTTTLLRIDDPAYFDRLADVEARHWWALGLWRLASYWLDAALAGQSSLRALDVGCGTGLTAARLAARPEIRDAVGLDPSPVALAIACRRHAGPLVRGSALVLPFEPGRFDVITCFDVLQHLPPGGDRATAVELHRVLRPGGLALVRSNGHGFSGGGSAYRLADLTRLFRGAGFLIRRASYANALPALAQEALGALTRATRPLHGRPAAPGHPSGGGLRVRVPNPAVNRLMGGVAAAEAWLAGRAGVPLPFGHSTLVLAERVDRDAEFTAEGAEGAERKREVCASLP